MEKLARLIIRYPLVILIGLIALTVFFATGIPKTTTRSNTDNELPKDDPIIATMRNLESIFGDRDIVLIGIESNDIFNRSSIKKIIDLSEDLKKIKYVIGNQVTSLSTVDNMESSEWGLEVGPYFETVPETDSALTSVIEKLKKNNLMFGRIVSKDHKFAAIIANLDEGYTQSIIYGQIQDLVKKYSDKDTRFFLAGDPIQQQEIDLGIQKDVGILLPLAIFLLLIGLFFVFRTFNGIWIPFMVVVFSIIWTMGFMGHFGLPTTVVSSAIPILMIAASASYGIHILERFYGEISTGIDRTTAIKNTIIHITPAVLMVGLTSALGSITLLIFRITSIREFGIIAAFGMCAALIISVLFVPSVLVLMKNGKFESCREKHSRKNPFLVWVATYLIKQRKVIISSTIVLLIIAIYGMTQVKIGSDFIKYFPVDHALRKTFDKFNEKLTGARYMDIMLESQTVDDLKEPKFLNQLDSLQYFVDGRKFVGSTYSFTDIIKRINMEMHEGDSVYERIPETREMVAQYLLLYSMSGGPDDFSDLIDNNYQRAKIRVMLKSSAQEDHLRIYNEVQQYAKNHISSEYNVEFGGEAIFWVAFIRYLVTGKIQNIIGNVIIVLLFCMLVFRSVTVGLVSVIPVLTSIIFTFGLMGFLGIRLDMGTAIITSMATGIGIDFACHFVNRLKEESAKANNIGEAIYTTLQTSGKAIIYGTISTTLGFIVFIFSGFTPLKAFGWLISFTMLTVSFATLVLLPVIFSYEKLKIADKLNNKKKKVDNSVVLPVDIPEYAEVE